MTGLWLSDRAERMLWRLPGRCRSTRNSQRKIWRWRPCASPAKFAFSLTRILLLKSSRDRAGKHAKPFSRIKGTEQLMTSKSEKELVYAPGGNGAEPVEGQELLPALDDMTPREIVVELDKYIVGQTAAKRAVAVALRNRVRRQKLPPEMAEDVLPKNILMIRPTRVGKTESAGPLARLAGCPLVRAEASKYPDVCTSCLPLDPLC